MNCKNCIAPLSQESDYCYQCGGKVIRNRLTMRNLFDHFTEAFFNYDNQFYRTFISLFIKPWEVIDSYVDGTRKKYISPLSFFAISLTLSGIYVFIVQKFFMDYFDMSQFYGNGPSEKVGADIMKISFEYYSLLYFLLIPGLALISRIVFFNKRYNYTEHVVMFFYTMSLFSVVSSVLSILVLNFQHEFMINMVLVLYVIYFFYHINIYRKLFSLNTMQVVLKVLLFIPIFFLGYIILSIGILILMFLFGVVSLQDFAPPS